MGTQPRAAGRRLKARECARVTRPYILQAIKRLEGGIQHGFGEARVYEVVSPSGFRAAPTAVFGLAASEALGIEVKPADFNAGQGTPCFRAIRAAGLAIEPIAQSDVALSDEDATWVEGSARRMSHIRLERDPRAARRKKAQYKALHGRLECERCRFVPTDVYGDADGEACIEVHHKTPLAELRGERATRLKDLQCVCANCHRVLHRKMRARLGASAAR